MNGLMGPLVVTYADARTEEVLPTGSDGIEFERHFEIPFSAIYSDDGVRMEHFWYCGWLGTKRAHPDTGGFDTWAETVDTVAMAPAKATRKKTVPLDQGS
jgi:hypothetical protein